MQTKPNIQCLYCGSVNTATHWTGAGKRICTACKPKLIVPNILVRKRNKFDDLAEQSMARILARHG